MTNQHVKNSFKAIMAAMVLSFALVACNNGSEPAAAPATTDSAAVVTPKVDSAAVAPKVDSAAMKMDTTKKDTAGKKPVVTK